MSVEFAESFGMDIDISFLLSSIYQRRDRAQRDNGPLSTGCWLGSEKVTGIERAKRLKAPKISCIMREQDFGYAFDRDI
jgi:hypothetical protein